MYIYSNLLQKIKILISLFKKKIFRSIYIIYNNDMFVKCNYHQCIHIVVRM